MVEKSSKSIENKNTHWAMRLVLIGKHAHRKGNINNVRKQSQAISSNFTFHFWSTLAKMAKDKCTHCVIDLNYCIWWLSTAPLNRIIALWVHPLTDINATDTRPISRLLWCMGECCDMPRCFAACDYTLEEHPEQYPGPVGIYVGIWQK